MGKKEQNKRYRIKIRALMNAAKDGVPCFDCGGIFSLYVMEFDHVGIKTGTVPSLAGRCSPAKIRAEIEQCEVVCANCHKVRTYHRRNREV